MAKLLDAPRVPEMKTDMPADGVLDDGDVRVTRRGKSVEVDFNPGARRVSSMDSKGHGENLVDKLSDREQMELAEKTLRKIEADLHSREDWQSRMDQAMELLGLRNIPMEDLPFEGASSVTYPLIGEAVVQFQARAIEEAFPSEGPVKTKVVGKRDMERVEQAERVKDHMNYQMVDQDKAYFWHTDQMLFYLPLAGSAFKKTYPDTVQDMVVSRFVKAEDLIVAYTATDLHSAVRYTHRMRMTDVQLKKLFHNEFYREVELPDTIIDIDSDTIGNDSGRAMEDEADSRTPSVDEHDRMYTVYECHMDWEFEPDQKRYGKKDVPLPYVITIENESRKILSIRRNWKEQDDKCLKRVWFTHYRYLPGLGFYGFGLLHMIGSVAETSSGTIRALLDSAAFSNMQGGFMSKDAKLAKGDNHITPGLYKECDMTAEELSRAFYTPPFKQPSPALVELFNVITDAGRRFASITDENVGDAPNTGPVGTTVALIEQASKVFSGVHRRLHMSQAEEFQLRAELNFEWLPQEYPYEIDGESKQVYQQDYDGRVDVVPVSDPNVFSSTQRIAQAQALLERSQMAPDLYDRNKVEERFLQAIRIPDYEELLVSNEVKRCDPVTENAKMLTGRAAKAFLEQDHDAHIQVHMSFMQGLNDEAMMVAGPILEAHLAEHYAHKYWVNMNARLEGVLPPLDLDGNDEEQEELAPEVEALIAQAAAMEGTMELMPQSEPPPSEEEFKQIAFENEERRKDEEHQNRLAREAEAHAEKLRQAAEAALTEEARRELMAMAEEARKDAESRREQAREDREFKREQKREDKETEAEIKRQNQKAKASGNQDGARKA
ncbi:MAG: hypothetical protein AMS21_01865 [Gemmatimonas sp. SG8_38_2]|nr:MAG: hypothetical protein AMS21_01865 [Gemmatimonas sp. SG8_38_2]